ncbi:MAG: cystathionine beta-synthase [Actinobacteria bacterium]|nr:cystathionine beta-synthase [Actinomycetota bacterium]
MGIAYNNILETIGRTPLVKLNNITKNIKSKIYVKVEYFNPGGSVKDRVGISMIEAAEKEGLLKLGGTIIEATAGNTGVGIAIAASIKKYRTIFILPDKMSEDKIALLKAYGAEVIITPTSVPPDSPESYNGVAERLSKEIKGAFRPNQFMNKYNPIAHYLTTGPEIWEDTEGKIDVFVAGIGTGGTISGIGKYLKEKNPNIIIIGADPEGSILSGDSPKPFKVEGIGEDFIPKTFNNQIVDEMIRISDKESFNTARELARLEGLLVGGSSGTAVAAAIKFARRLDVSKYIVALLPDTGRNYMNKIFSDKWMLENGFFEKNVSKTKKIKNILESKIDFPKIISISSTEPLVNAINIIKKYSISQLPVIDDKKLVGSLNEASIMKIVKDNSNYPGQKIASVMGKPLPKLDEDLDVLEAYRILLTDASGIVVTRENIPVSVITRTDLINFWLIEGEK